MESNQPKASPNFKKTLTLSLLAGIFAIAVIALVLVVCLSGQATPQSDSSQSTAATDAVQDSIEPSDSESIRPSQKDKSPEASDSSMQAGGDPTTLSESEQATEPVSTSSDQPYLYNPDGTPELPQSQPDLKSFDIPGFSPLTNVSLGDMGHNLSLAAVGRYTGAFMEDGTDEAVENVLALVIENQSDEIIEYAALQVTLNGEPATFRISALPGHSYCLVLEQNRAYAREDAALALPEIVQFAPLKAAVLDYSRDFAIYPAPGTITIQNISGEDISSEVFLYFKTFEHGIYMGGIAYRVSFPEGVEKGQLGQSLQKHFLRDSSVILYMNYEKN